MVMKAIMHRCAATLVLLLITTAAFAQQGTLRGVVTDSLTAETLPGANVYLLGTSLGNATNLDGTYRIGGIPAGSYTLRVSYLGYQVKEVPVTITGGETTTQNVGLVLGVIQGEDIIITAQAEGQAAAINQQLTSNTIVNVISEEKIQELPDANAAEAIGRLPGVSVQRSGGEANQIVLRGLGGAFTNVTVDGVRIASTDAEARSVDLSAISQGSLAGIELFKALTPDKDADAIAGSVNLVTRRAPRERQFRMDAMGGYNELVDDLGQYDLDFRYGERFLGDILGVQLTGNIEQRNRSNEQYDTDYDCSINDFTVCLIENLQLDFTDEIRRRRGLGAIVDVETPDGGFVKLSGLYNQTSRDFITYSRSYPTLDDLVFYTARDREQAIHLFNGALTGENYLFGLNTDWGASYARSAFNFPFDYEVVFTEPSITEGGTPVAGMRAVPDSVRRGELEGIIPYALNNFEKAYLYSGFYRTEESTDTDLSAYLNLARDYGIGSSLRGELKVGGKFRSKSRSRDRTELFSPYYNEPFPMFVMLEDGSVVPKDFSGTMFEDLALFNNRLILATNFLGSGARSEDLYDRFTLSPLLDRDAVRAWWDLNGNGFIMTSGDPQYRENPEARGDFYDITERVSAAYVMNTFNIGQRIMWIVGLRVEHENNDYASRYAPNGLDGYPVPSGAIRDTSATHEETVWLPNTHLTIRPTDFLTVRLAAYRALARPDFNSRLANVVARRSSTFFPGNNIQLGNPNLRAAKAWNYEINTSFFGRRIGLFSVSLFYKDIQDYFQRINGLTYEGDAVFDSLGIDFESPFGTGGEFSLVVPFNSTSPTTVYGVEVEHQTNLRFLPGLLSGLVIGYNFSIVRSSTHVPRVRIETTFIERPPFPPIAQIERIPYESEQKLQQQPDFFANVSLGYDFRAFSARLSVFHQDAYNTSFAGNERTGFDNLQDGFTRVDLAFKQGIGRRIALLVNINNITGVEEAALRYNSFLDRTLVNDSEIYGTTVDVGLRVNL